MSDGRLPFEAAPLPVLLRWLPGWMRKHFAHRPGLIKIFDNIGWLFFDKILRMGVGILVGIWVARYFGPTLLGKYSYVMSIVVILDVVASLGMNNILVKKNIEEEQDIDSVYGTGFILFICGGVVSYLICAWIAIINDDLIIKYGLFIVGASLLFKNGDAGRCLFQANSSYKSIIKIELCVFCLCTAARLVAILNCSNIYTFMYIYFVESLMMMVLIFFASFKSKLIHSIKVSYRFVIDILSESLPLMVAGLADVVHMQIDMVMLKEMLGDSAVGLYSVGVKISSIFYIIPTVIVTAALPRLAGANKNSIQMLEHDIKLLLSYVVKLSIVLSIFVVLISPWLIDVVYGVEYKISSRVLSVYVWTFPFFVMGVIGNQWLIMTGSVRVVMARTVFCCIVNVMLNSILIPFFGYIGAALSSVVSYFVNFYFIDALFDSSRRLFVMKTRSLYWY